MAESSNYGNRAVEALARLADGTPKTVRLVTGGPKVNPDIQYFSVSGTWVKPPRAVAIDAVTCGGGAGANGTEDGESGELRVQRFRADELPAELTIEVGKGGRPGGRDGYALIVTHLAESEGSAGVLLQGVR